MSNVENVKSQSFGNKTEDKSSVGKPNPKDVNEFEELLHKGDKKEDTLKQLLGKSEKALTERATKGELAMPTKAELAMQTKGDALLSKNELAMQTDLESQIEMPKPESLFSSMFGGQGQAQPNQVGTAQADTQAVSSSSQILSTDEVQSIANRILVSTPKDGGAEIKISFNDKVLASTDVTITKSLDGQLQVQFTTTNANSFQSLVSAQDNLKDILKQNNPSVRVEISQEQNDSNQQSRGRQEYTNEDWEKA